MIDVQTTVLELETLLAERFTLPCPGCHAPNYLGDSEDGWASGCPDCGGSGVQHPLRVACPGTHYPPYLNDIHHHEDCLCGGPGGHVFNPDPDALTVAIRAKGWEREEKSRHFSNGDAILLYGWEGNTYHRLAIVVEEDGLRDRHALLLVTARAVEAVNQ